MPIYEYKGQQYDISTEDPDEAKSKILSFLESQQQNPGKEKTNLLQDIGAGLRGIGETGHDALWMAGAGAAGLVGANTFQESMFDRFARVRKERQEAESKLDRGETGKVARAVGQIPAYLNPLSAGLMIAGSGVNTGSDLVEQGADTTHALAGMGADIGLGVGSLGLGAFANVANKGGNALLQGGLNTAQEALANHPIQNKIRESAGVQQLPDMTPGDYAAAFIPGATIGAVHAPGRTSNTPSVDPRTGEVIIPRVSDLDSQFIARNQAKLESIHKQILFKEGQLEKISSDSPNGLSEKQLALYKSLEEQQKKLLEEASQVEDILSKYDQKSSEDPIKSLSVEDLVGKQPSAENTVGKSQRGSWDPLLEWNKQGKDEQDKLDSWRNQLASTDDQLKNTQNNPSSEHASLDIPAFDELGRQVQTTKVDPNIHKNSPDTVQGENMYGQKVTDVVGESEIQRRLDLESDIPDPKMSSVDYSKARSSRGVNTLGSSADRRTELKNEISSKQNALSELRSRYYSLQRENPSAKGELTKLENEIKINEASLANNVREINALPKGLNTLIGNFSRNKQRGSWSPFLGSEEQKVNQAKAVANSTDRINDLDVTKLSSPDELFQKMTTEGAKDSGYKIESNLFGFGQFTEAVRKQAPIIWEIAKRIKKVDNIETELKRTLWSGDASSLPTKGFGPFMSLAHYLNPDSLSIVTKQMTVADKVVVSELLHENSQLGRKHQEADTSNLTPIQKKAYDLSVQFYDRIQQETGVKRRNGYIHSTREGDFAVGLKTSMGDVTHIQSFKSREQAQQWLDTAKKSGIETTDLIDMTTKEGATLGESFGIIRDLVTDLQDRLKLSGKIIDELDSIQNWVADHSTIGKHNVRKVGYSGAEGSKLFVSKEQNAKDFFKSMEDYAGEVATQWKKTLLTREVNDFFNSESGHKLETVFPEQSATAKYLVDIAMNKQGKYQWAEGVDSIRKGIDDLFSKSVNKFKGEDSPLYYPDVPVLDRSIGIAAQLFYIKALTSRPSFWAGQLLTSPFSIRQVLKEGSLLEAISAQGKGWGSVLSGGDAGFKKFVQNLKETTDSLHPQFTNEINVLPFMGDKANTSLGKIIDWVSGQKPSAIADTLSRYFTMATAYHFYKDMGMSGDTLKANVQNMVDNTMVMYGRGSTSPVLQKMGIVGQAIAPLQKFGLAQLQNFVGDLRHMASQPGAYGKLKGSLPAISTLLTTMVMGGVQGTILLTEYEMIRRSLAAICKNMGWDDLHDMLPKPVMESILTHDNMFVQMASGMYQSIGASEQFSNDAATHGIPSAVTGFDIGSSTRFQPYVPGSDGTKEVSLLDMMPVIKSITDTLGDFVIPKVSETIGGQRTEAELRKADLSQQLFVGQRALIDKFKYNSDSRSFVPGGTRGYAQVEQTPKEQIAQFLGTSTLSTAKDRAIVGIEKQDQKKLSENRQHAIDLMADGILLGKDDKLDRGLELAIKYEMNEKMIKQAVESVIKERHQTRREDLYGTKPKSYEQKRKFIRDMAYE